MHELRSSWEDVLQIHSRYLWTYFVFRVLLRLESVMARSRWSMELQRGRIELPSAEQQIHWIPSLLWQFQGQLQSTGQHSSQRPGQSREIVLTETSQSQAGNSRWHNLACQCFSLFFYIYFHSTIISNPFI